MNEIAASTSFPLPQLSLTAQSVGVPQNVYVGLNLTNGWVKVWNESPFQLQASDGAGAWMHEVSAQAIDVFPLDPGVKFFTLLPIGLLPFAAPSYRVRLALFPDGPPPGSYPQALGRQAAPTSAAAPLGYSYANSNVPGASGVAAYFLYNPVGSGVNALLYAASYSAAGASTNPTNPSLNTISSNTGIAGTSQTPVPHLTGGPASKMQLTVNNAFTGSGALTGLSPVDQLQSSGSAAFEKQFHVDNDQLAITPGNGAVILANQLSGIVLYTMNMRWTEQ